MASKKGCLLTCDRCGKNVFLALLGKDYYDGGYSSSDKFEKYPEGWKYLSIGTYTTLCPECYAEWERILKAFMEGANVEDEKES